MGILLLNIQFAEMMKLK